VAEGGAWPQARWNDALHVWSDKKLASRSWQSIAPVLARAPEEVLSRLAHSLGRWLTAVAKGLEGDDQLFFATIRRVLALDVPDAPQSDEPITLAINHPMGHVTEALIFWWFRQSPSDDQGLPEQLKSMLTELCQFPGERLRHGRVLLASHLVALFRGDPVWTRQHLLPWFDWKRSQAEARAVWSGYLWTPRVDRPLMDALKPYFPATASHYDDLGKFREQYASLLTFVALDKGDAFTTEELRDHTGLLPPDGLHAAARTLRQSLEAAGEQRGEYWNNRVVPYIGTTWPSRASCKTAEIAEEFARLCIAAGEHFGVAVKELRNWLKPIRWPSAVVRLLAESGRCEDQPEPALDLLSAVVGGSTQWAPRELRKCLDGIKSGLPGWSADDRFRKLDEDARKREG